MTAKEAIMQIQAIPEKIWDQLSEPDRKAMEMAFSALQEQDSPKPIAESVQNVQNEDLISRKAAIDAVEHITSSMSVCVNTDECHGMKRMQRQAVIELANLPSAQPEKAQLSGEDATFDCVSRQAVIDALKDWYDGMIISSFRGIEKVIKTLPSAQPEPCEDAVSRDSVKFLLCKETCHPGAFCPDGLCREICEKVDALPSATPKQRMGEWIPVSERLPEKYGNYLISIHGEDEPDIGTINPNDKRGWSLCDANGFHWASDKKLIVTAWMPLPKPYRAERRTDEAD